MNDIAFTVEHYSGRLFEGCYNPIRKIVKIKVDGINGVDEVEYSEHEVMQFLITGTWSIV